MDIQLTTGVDLHIIATKQFKVTRILVNFATEQRQISPSARNLVANLLVTSSANSRTQTVLARHLNDRYGASLSGYVSRVGLAQTVQLQPALLDEQAGTGPLVHQGGSL